MGSTHSRSLCPSRSCVCIQPTDSSQRKVIRDVDDDKLSDVGCYEEKRLEETLGNCDRLLKEIQMSILTIE